MSCIKALWAVSSRALFALLKACKGHALHDSFNHYLFYWILEIDTKIPRHKTLQFFHKHSVRIYAGVSMISMPCSGFQYFSFARFEVLTSQFKKVCSRGVIAIAPESSSLALMAS